MSSSISGSLIRPSRITRCSCGRITSLPYSVATLATQSICLAQSASANSLPSVVPEKINISAIFSPFPGLLSALICTRLSACPDLIAAFCDKLIPHDDRL